jgi:hypothetical protein
MGALFAFWGSRGGPHDLGVEISRASPRSRWRGRALIARRTISTFSCDIAYSRSPTASRAFRREEAFAIADDLPVVEGVNGRVFALGFEAAAPASQPPPYARNHLIAGIDQF